MRDSELASTPTSPRYSRRLCDRILIAFHHACDEGELDIAEHLLPAVEKLATRSCAAPDAHHRRSMENLIAAHERLWHLRNPDGMPD